MTAISSKRKSASNQRNAQNSTGPRSESGKATSSMNALKHGLSAQPLYDPHTLSRIDDLARDFAGENQENAKIFAQARAAAEAQIMVERVALARAQVWMETATSKAITDRGQFKNFNSRSGMKYFRTVTGFPAAGFKQLAPYLFSEPFETEVEEQAEVLRIASKKLLKLIRYERRAANQRNKALRKLAALIDNDF